MKPDAETEMRAFLLERYGIETNAQLWDRIWKVEKINLAIFTEPIETGPEAGKGRDECTNDRPENKGTALAG